MFSRRCRQFAVSAFCLVVLYLMLAIPLASQHRALALSSDSSISITAQSTSVNFPNSITFNVSATDSNSNITTAEIIINLQSFSGPETDQVKISAPQRSIKLQWIEKTTGDNFVPPGTDINYFWRFTDSAGTTYFQPQQSLTTSDTRFSWQHLSQGLLQ